MSETVMYINGLCRCCHARGSCRSLGVPYMLGDGQEIYSDMLRETFNITISPDYGENSESTYTICESCIISLRDAARFKQQVLSCEEKLHKLLLKEDFKYEIGEADGNSSEDSRVLNPIKIIDEYYVGADGRATKEEAESTLPQLKHDVDGEADGYSYSEDAGFSALEPKVEIDEQQEAPPKPQKPAVSRKRKIGTTLTPQDSSDADCVPSRQKRSRGRSIKLSISEHNERTCRICNKQIACTGLANHMKIHRKDYVKGRLFTCYMCRYQTALYNDYLQHYELKHFDGDGYPCSACDSSFSSAKSLREHYNEHYENEIVKCGKCNKDVKRKCLVKHYKIHMRFICNICNQCFPTKQSLILHTSRHEGLLEDHKLKQRVKKSNVDSVSPKQKKRKGRAIEHRKIEPKEVHCKICNQNIPYRGSKLHMIKHRRDNKTVGRCFTCRICNHQSKSHKEYYKHYELEHFDGEGYPCSTCDVSFSSAKMLKKHYDEHYENEIVQCDICEKEVKRVYFGPHYKTHIQRFVCDICKKCFNAKRDLMVHLSTHDGVKAYLCDKCGRSYSSNHGLNRHKQKTHAARKVYTCSFCQKQLFSGHSHRRHEALHTGNTPFICEICKKGYTDKNTLKTHMTSHMEGKPFSCRHCGLNFKYKGTLKKHENKHTGAKKFDCEICKKAFFQNHDLMRHMRMHTGEKPQRCKICGQRFTNKSSLRRHTLRKHGDTILENEYFVD